MGIRAGSLLRADGGFLVLNAADVFSDARVWAVLKTMLKNRKLEIHEPEFVIMASPSALKPEPIELNLKVIMIARLVLQHGQRRGRGLRQDLQVKAESTPRWTSPSEPDHFVDVVMKVTGEEKLLKPTLGAGLSDRVLHAPLRYAGAPFHPVLGTANVLREASYVAREEGKKLVTLELMKKALYEQTARTDLVEQKIHQMIRRGASSSTRKPEGGQVNGSPCTRSGSSPSAVPAASPLPWAWAGGADQRRAGVRPVGPYPRQGVLVSRLHPAAVRADLSALPCGEPVLRAVLQRRGRRQRLVHRGLCPPVELSACPCGRTWP